MSNLLPPDADCPRLRPRQPPSAGSGGVGGRGDGWHPSRCPAAVSDSSHATSVRSSIRLYLFVGAVLFIGTVVTVAVATVPWLDVGGHGFDKADMILGLIIASVKALLVAAVFMHLNHERSLIYFLIGLAAAHAVGMFAFTMLSEVDSVRDPLFYHGSRSTDPGGVSVSRGPFPQTETTPRPRNWVGP